MRKLASVQTIWDVQPIEGADRIEVVSVLGWKCVAKKGEFKKYDLCVYFEVDAFLPVKPEFEFLRDGCYRSNDLNGEGFLMKTGLSGTCFAAFNSGRNSAARWSCLEDW